MDAQRLLDRAFTKYKKKHPNLKITDLAKEIGLPYTSVYSPIFERRRCSADNWLKIMAYLGAVDIGRTSVKIN